MADNCFAIVFCFLSPKNPDKPTPLGVGKTQGFFDDKSLRREGLLRLDKERVMLAYCDSPDKVADSMRDGLVEIISGEQGRLMVRINHCIKCRYYNLLD